MINIDIKKEKNFKRKRRGYRTIKLIISQILLLMVKKPEKALMIKKLVTAALMIQS